MKTLTICGSLRYEREMPVIAFKLETKHGYNVLQCVYNLEKEEVTAAEMDTLKKAHFQRIDMSDGIYVVDIDGYMGDSVKREIAYAKENGKEVIMHSSYDL